MLDMRRESLKHWDDNASHKFPILTRLNCLQFTSTEFK